MQHWMERTAAIFCGLALIILLAGVRPATAQDQGPPQGEMMGPPPGEGGPQAMNVDRQLTRLVKRYNLSDTQKTQIRPILEDGKKKMDALFQDSSLAPEDRFAKFKAIRDDQVARVSALLNDEQRAKYQKDETRNGEGGGPDGPDGPPPPPPGGDEGGGGGPPPPPPGN